MNDQHIARFFKQQPFESFSIYLADGRTLFVKHPEQASVGMYAASVVFTHDDDSVEVVDASQIVSFRTLHPSDSNSYTG